MHPKSAQSKSPWPMGMADSPDSFQDGANGITGQGVLQGSSSAAPLFILNSDISLTAYSKSSTGATFYRPIKKPPFMTVPSCTSMTHLSFSIPLALILTHIQTLNKWDISFYRSPQETHSYGPIFCGLQAVN